jgi:maltose alpha-D-glucosyltransferase / alpha-amylase
VLALRCDWRNNSVLMHNLSPIPTEVKFRAGAKVDGQLVNLLSNDHSTPDASGKHRVLLESYGYRWFRIGASIIC